MFLMNKQCCLFIMDVCLCIFVLPSLENVLSNFDEDGENRWLEFATKDNFNVNIYPFKFHLKRFNNVAARASFGHLRKPLGIAKFDRDQKFRSKNISSSRSEIFSLFDSQKMKTKFYFNNTLALDFFCLE